VKKIICVCERERWRERWRERGRERERDGVIGKLFLLHREHSRSYLKLKSGIPVDGVTTILRMALVRMVHIRITQTRMVFIILTHDKMTAE
jgi:hypothetical protein